MALFLRASNKSFTSPPGGLASLFREVESCARIFKDKTPSPSSVNQCPHVLRNGVCLSR